MLRFLVFFISVLICTSFLTSCENDNLSIGKDWLNPATRMVKIDTFTVNLSTMWVDSVVSSNKSIALIGQYDDPYVGKISASSYIELSVPSTSGDNEVDSRSKLDSLMIHLVPNGNYFGDTTLVQHIDVYKTRYTLTFEETTSSSGTPVYSLYNSSSTEIENTPIASGTFTVQPNRPDRTFDIRLPDAIGEEILEMLMDKTTEVSNSDEFAKYFKALALLPGQNNESGIISYYADTTFKMTLYYSVISETKVEKQLSFTANTSRQYNKITADRSQTLLSELGKRNVEIPSSLTSNQSYVASGVPLYTKIEFPSINNLLLIGQYGKIQSAILTIKPIKSSYTKDIPLPQQLHLYVIDGSDQADNYISDANNNIQTGSLYIDYEFYENTRYRFDITNYLNSQLGASDADKRNLQLMIPASEEATAVKRLVLGNTENDLEVNQINLEIYYTSYYGEN